PCTTASPPAHTSRTQVCRSDATAPVPSLPAPATPVDTPAPQALPRLDRSRTHRRFGFVRRGDPQKREPPAPGHWAWRPRRGTPRYAPANQRERASLAEPPPVPST